MFTPHKLLYHLMFPFISILHYCRRKVSTLIYPLQVRGKHKSTGLLMPELEMTQGIAIAVTVTVTVIFFDDTFISSLSFKRNIYVCSQCVQITIPISVTDIPAGLFTSPIIYFLFSRGPELRLKIGI